MLSRSRATFPLLLLAALACRAPSPATSPAPVSSVALRFEPVGNALTAEVFGSPGSAWADIDGDGHVDVAIAARDSMPNRVYRGTPRGFEPIALATPVGQDANAIAWGDIDNDGDLDLAIGMPVLMLYETRIEAGLVRLDSVPLGGAVTADQRPRGALEALAFGDIDGDGDLDLAIGSHGGAGSYLLLNNGRGRFTPHERDAFPFASYMGGVHLADLDRDARPDLLFLGSPFPNFRTGTFTYWQDNAWTADRATAMSAQPGGLGGSLADIDHDGDLDLFQAGWRETTPSVLYRNLGSRRFAARDTLPPRIIGSAFGDIDNDGDTDLVTASGYTSIGRIGVWLNDGTGNLRSVDVLGLTDQPGAYTGLTLVDHDRDGRLDIFVSSLQAPSRMWRNTSALPGSWLQVEVRTPPGGKAIYPAMVVAAFEGIPGPRTRHIPIHQQGGYGGHGEPVAHIGIPAGATVRSIVVKVPGGREIPVRVATGRRIVVPIAGG